MSESVTAGLRDRAAKRGTSVAWRGPRADRSNQKSKHERLGLLDLRQGLHLGEDVRRHCAVDLDQRDGVTARRGAAKMEGRDVDLCVTQQACEPADEARLVLVGDIDHRLAEFGVDPDTL